MEASASRQSRFFEEGDGRTITDKCFWGIPYLKKILGDKKSLEREVFGRVVWVWNGIWSWGQAREVNV